jgi:hypothetical protein
MECEKNAQNWMRMCEGLIGVLKIISAATIHARTHAVTGVYKHPLSPDIICSRKLHPYLENQKALDLSYMSSVQVLAFKILKLLDK